MRSVSGTGMATFRRKRIQKTRPDDFKGEIAHLSAILKRGRPNAVTPVHLSGGLETMLVVAAAHQSHQRKKAGNN